MDYTLDQISGAIVAYNEEKCIRRALENLQRFCKEIVLFDSMSTDSTLKIAEEYDCRIYRHKFDNHRDQKNRAIQQCKMPWVFLLDADEYCNNTLIDHINNKGLIDSLERQGIDALGIPRYNLEDGVGPRGWPDIQTRLFKQHCRHIGHPFHHETTGNAKNPVVETTSKYGFIIHDKTLEQQKERNRLYYYMRPGDYKGVIPQGAEGMVVPPENYNERFNVNVYEEFITKEIK